MPTLAVGMLGFAANHRIPTASVGMTTPATEVDAPRRAPPRSLYRGPRGRRAGRPPARARYAADALRRSGAGRQGRPSAGDRRVPLRPVRVSRADVELLHPACDVARRRA